jgi:hypothetical protein
LHAGTVTSDQTQKKTERQAQKIALRKMLIFGHKNTFEQLTGGKKEAERGILNVQAKASVGGSQSQVAVAAASPLLVSKHGLV